MSRHDRKQQFFSLLCAEERDGLQWKIMQNLDRGKYDGMDPDDVIDRVYDELEQMARDDTLVAFLREEYRAHYALMRGRVTYPTHLRAVLMSEPPIITGERPDVNCRDPQLMDWLFPPKSKNASR